MVKNFVAGPLKPSPAVSLSRPGICNFKGNFNPEVSLKFMEYPHGLLPIARPPEVPFVNFGVPLRMSLRILPGYELADLWKATHSLITEKPHDHSSDTAPS